MQISLRQANRYLLKRQHLLAPCHDALQAVRDACGLQAQIPSTPAMSLRARVSGFTLADYDRMISEERSLVRTWAMRGTVHTLPTETMARYTRVFLDNPALSEPAEKALTLLMRGPGTRGQLAQPVRVLPRFDSILLGHRDRQRLIDDAFRTRVFRPAAVVEAVVLVHDRVAGTWRMKKTTRELQVVYEPFRKARGGVPPKAIDAEFRRLATWLGLERLALSVSPGQQ